MYDDRALLAPEEVGEGGPGHLSPLALLLQTLHQRFDTTSILAHVGEVLYTCHVHDVTT